MERSLEGHDKKNRDWLFGLVVANGSLVTSK